MKLCLCCMLDVRPVKLESAGIVDGGPCDRCLASGACELYSSLALVPNPDRDVADVATYEFGLHEAWIDETDKRAALDAADSYMLGWYAGYLESRRRAVDMGVVFMGGSYRSTSDPRVPLPDVRDYLLEIGYSEILASRVALFATAREVDRTATL